MTQNNNLNINALEFHEAMAEIRIKFQTMVRKLEEITLIDLEEFPINHLSEVIEELVNRDFKRINDPRVASAVSCATSKARAGKILGSEVEMFIIDDGGK